MDRWTPPPECAARRDDLAALATGTLAEAAQSDLEVHVAGCGACAAELEQLAAAVDALAGLAPAAEPPAGFADRTVARLRAEAAPARPPVRRWLAGAAAAAVAAAVATATVLAVGGPGSATVRTAGLSSRVGVHGMVTVAQARQTLLFVTVDDTEAWGTAACRVTLTNGSSWVVGRFALPAGYQSWDVHLRVPVSSVRTVSVVSAAGTTIASARLAP